MATRIATNWEKESRGKDTDSRDENSWSSRMYTYGLPT